MPPGALSLMVPLLLPLLLLLRVPAVAANGHHRTAQALEPARLSCNAAYAAPCSRTNAQWLAETTARNLSGRVTRGELKWEDAWEEVTNGTHNMDVGFYPYAFNRSTRLCVAHPRRDMIGLTFKEMFELSGNAFIDANAAMDRVFEAADAGGGWIWYIWNRGEPGSGGNKKIAYVANVTDEYVLGVGYESTFLPTDEPCSADYDAWCSITNVRSLLGRGISLLAMVESVPQFESATYDLTFDAEYQIMPGFYIFMYSFEEGRLFAHPKLPEYLGRSFADVMADKGLVETEEDAWDLHHKFVDAANGLNDGWVRYLWKNTDDGRVFTKIAYLVRFLFQDKWYYLGCGFDFNMMSTSDNLLSAETTSNLPETSLSQALVDADSTPCTQDFNLPCSFRMAMQLSSHALVHALSSPMPEQETWDLITNDPMFHYNDFYVFVANFNGTVVSHGLVPHYAGYTVAEIFEETGIAIDGNLVHQNFYEAAERGGGWVLYDWMVPGVKDSLFQKVSFIFQINLGEKKFYGGVGFNHQRAPLEIYTEDGFKANGERILCSQEYGLPCSDNNARALLGQASAEMTLASSNARVTNHALQQISRKVDDILNAINEKDPAFTVNDFYVSVFHTGSFFCRPDDDAGCCVAHGSDRDLVGKNWQEILDRDSITSITGRQLHYKLIENSNRDYGTFDYLYSQPTGEARTKRAMVAGFHDVTGEDLYVVAEYFLTTPNPPCDRCPDHMECTEPSQAYCLDKAIDPADNYVPWVVTLSLLIISSAIGFYWYKRRNWRKRQVLAKRIKQMEEQMKGMVEIIHDTGMQITSAQDYRDKFGLGSLGKVAARTKQVKIIWSWEENRAFLPRHSPSTIITGTSFVKYGSTVSAQIEHAYKRWKEGRGFKEFRVDLTDKVRKFQNQASGSQYVIDFEVMTQKNIRSQHSREVRRQELVVEALHSGVVDHLPRLPPNIDFFGAKGEDFLPTFEGQVIQVSKENSDRQWLYGSVIYDPLLIDAQNNPNGNLGTEGLNRILSLALHDRPTSGWFPAAVSKPADVKVMKNLLQSLGSEGMSNLKEPGTWEKNKEGCIRVAEGSEEWRAVVGNFLAALYDQVDYVNVVSVERVQCTPLWQSYAVKKETMKKRDAKNPESRVNNHEPGVERKWLFHGTTLEVIPKIVKQGFNRAFAGRNAVAFGKGVYFARDASYSSHRAYSTPDHKGIQHIFMCRVAVGDWCQGTNGQLTPDPKPRNPLELFDSTVDNVIDPSIFVVYHDAQAYPDYLVSFKRND